MCFKMIRTALGLILVSIIQGIGLAETAEEKSIVQYFDHDESCIHFAATEIQSALLRQGITSELHPLDAITETPRLRIIMTESEPSHALAQFQHHEALDLGTLGSQDYLIRVIEDDERKTFWVIGGDRIGVMYGGLHLAEQIAALGLAAIKDDNQSPYVEKRGIKFNIPLDHRTPSHDDRGTAAQANVANMWDMEFWADYFDELARTRYNVLSLWTQHPFPSLVKLEDYPDVALSDVYNASGKVKTLSIDQKIVIWNKVMEYAYNRGIEIYFITWNIHTTGVDGKYGITEYPDNRVTKDYLRKSVKALFTTYPRLAGIGVTAGENMGDMEHDDKEMTHDQKEQWLWDTYGKAVQEVKAEQPDRHIRFIHRYWWTDFELISKRFSKLDDGFDISFKYARARMFAVHNPPYAENELLPILPEGMKSWWNIRNDDIYNLRWGDPDYVKQFILHLPSSERTAGYYMGSDRYVWGRESISKHPTQPRQLENSKHWYNFFLWGRLGYDPNTPTELIKGLIQNRFPSVPAESLYNAWQSASQIVPQVNRFHWFSWDFRWWTEAGISSGVGRAIDGYHTIQDFIDTPTLKGAGILTIPQYCDTILTDKKIAGITPLEVAEQLEASSGKALQLTKGMSGGENRELSETIGDIRAMAYLGAYYASKIRGATDFALYQVSHDKAYQTSAIKHLQESLEQWQHYGKILSRQYHKMHISIQGTFDWDALEADIKQDISVVRKTQLTQPQ